jgi:D-tyrosyl-tRNA(Tyr) deacylase
MKAWVQRVSSASVDVEGKRIAEIGKGYLVLLGITHTDTSREAEDIAARICTLRIFEDESGKANRSLEDIGGEIIVVSQFTLYADTAHGRRPGFSAAAPRPVAEPLYEEVVRLLKARLGENRVGTGSFGAEMKVSLVNDGPFSVELVS